MHVIISARHTDVPAEIREHVERQVERLRRFEPRISKAEVTLWEEGKLSRAEALLSVDGRAPVHGQAEADAFRSAVDRLMDKLSRQLRRARSRVKDHRAPPMDELADPESRDT